MAAVASIGMALAGPALAGHATITPLNIDTVIGDGTNGSSGDGGPALSAQLNGPQTLEFDSAGNLYIADNGNHAIRKWDRTTGHVTTVAGVLGASGSDGDGGLATSAHLFGPNSAAIGPNDDLYIADTSNHAIRKVDHTTGIITTVVGTFGVGGDDGDGGPATSAHVQYPGYVTVTASGDIYFSDTGTYTVRKVDHTTGNISTVAGVNGSSDYSGDGGPATSAHFPSPAGVLVAPNGDIYISDNEQDSVVRKVDHTSGNISTIAGIGNWCASTPCGDGGPATSAGLYDPTQLRMDAAGNLFIADQYNAAVRRIDHATGIITTVAGGAYDYATGAGQGDGGPATSAKLYAPGGIAFDVEGNLFISDYQYGTVREVYNVLQIPLPSTGADPSVMIWTALAVLVVGFGFVMVQRRQRQEMSPA